MRMDISNRTLLPATLTLLLSAFFHQASAARAQAQDDANAAGKKLLEELYPRYCNGDIVKPGVHARLVTGEPLTNEACKRMRGQLEAYNAAPDGVPLARAPYVGDQQGLKYAYSHMCVVTACNPRWQRATPIRKWRSMDRPMGLARVCTVSCLAIPLRVSRATSPT